MQDMSKGISGIIKYGTKDAHITGKVKNTEPFLEVEITQGLSNPLIQSKLVGEYNLPNILVAVTVGDTFEVPEEKIKSAIENYEPTNSRSQLIEKDSNKIILDAYNANPSSMRLAIENFAKLKAPKKVLMLGAMAELGSESLQEHIMIIDLIKQNDWDQVALVGGDFVKVEHPYQSFENSALAKSWFQQQGFKNSYILIKGSRSMQMEKLLEN